MGWLSGNQSDRLRRAESATKSARKAVDQAGHRQTSRDNQRELRQAKDDLRRAEANERRARIDHDRAMRR